MKALLLLLVCGAVNAADLRKINGVVEPVTPGQNGWTGISGKVIQTIGNDALVFRDSTDEIVYIFNMPGASRLVDDEEVSVHVKYAGTKEYVSVLGAKKRVYAYDAGRTPTEKESEPYRRAVAIEERKNELLRLESEKAKQEEAKRLRERMELNRKAQSDRVVQYQLSQASNGLPSFQLEIAKRYMRGDGLPLDTNAAIYWLESALTNHLPEATNLLRTVKR